MYLNGATNHTTINTTTFIATIDLTIATIDLTIATIDNVPMYAATQNVINEPTHIRTFKVFYIGDINVPLFP